MSAGNILSEENWLQPAALPDVCLGFSSPSGIRCKPSLLGGGSWLFMSILDVPPATSTCCAPRGVAPQGPSVFVSPVLTPSFGQGDVRRYFKRKILCSHSLTANL